MPVETIASPWWWGAFLTIILVLFALDLGVFSKKKKDPSFKQALKWVIAWVMSALAFFVGLYLHLGEKPALEFLTGYLVEQSLSVDNIFVFLIIFSYFGTKPEYQRRVLFYGIVGAFVMRGIFILLGASLLNRFHWMTYVLGIILILSGIKLLRHKMEDVDPEKNPIVRLFKRLVPLTDRYNGDKFFMRLEGKIYATPLALVLVSIEVTDLVFAVDSIPAVLAITRDPFIVFTSNVFAILGLRSLFFVVSGALKEIRFLNIGLSLVLVFVGVKMLFLHNLISTGMSLAIISTLIGGSVIASFAIRAPKNS